MANKRERRKAGWKRLNMCLPMVDLNNTIPMSTKKDFYDNIRLNTTRKQYVRFVMIYMVRLYNRRFRNHWNGQYRNYYLQTQGNFR